MNNKDFTQLLKKAASSDIWDAGGTNKVTLGYALTWGYNRCKSECPELLAEIEREIEARAAMDIPLTATQNALLQN